MGRPPKCPDRLTEVTLKYALAKFVDDMRRGMAAQSTINSYGYILNVLIEIHGPTFPAWRLKRDLISEAITNIVDGTTPEQAAKRIADGKRTRKGRTGRDSISQVYTAMRQFVKYLHQRGWLDANEIVMSPVVRGRQATTDGRAPADRPKPKREQWGMILEAAGLIHPRLRIAVAFGLLCGRRASEIVLLRWENVDWGEGLIRFFNQKGQRIGELPLFPEIRAELERYREIVTARNGAIRPEWFIVAQKLSGHLVKGAGSQVLFKRNPDLWPMDPTRPIRVSTFVKENRRLLARFGYGANEGVGTHTWRRGAATHTSEVHGITVAQALLDHKSVVTTQVYTGNTEGKAKLWGALMPGVVPPGGWGLENVAPVVTKERHFDMVTAEEYVDNVVPIHSRRKDDVA